MSLVLELDPQLTDPKSIAHQEHWSATTPWPIVQQNLASDHADRSACHEVLREECLRLLPKAYVDDYEDHPAFDYLIAQRDNPGGPDIYGWIVTVLEDGEASVDLKELLLQFLARLKHHDLDGFPKEVAYRYLDSPEMALRSAAIRCVEYWQDRSQVGRLQQMREEHPDSLLAVLLDSVIVEFVQE